mgnify:CR=1 FL=1
MNIYGSFMDIFDEKKTKTFMSKEKTKTFMSKETKAFMSKTKVFCTFFLYFAHLALTLLRNSQYWNIHLYIL